MSLISLDILRLRNLLSVSLVPHPHLNLIVGPNASGKTSLLEAVYLLGRGQSFRTSVNSRLISDGQADCIVAGRFREGDFVHRIGIRLATGERRIRIDGRGVDSRAELLERVPVRIVDPSLYRLLEEAPRLRRRFLDWGVFYHDAGFLPAWRRYRRALQQRNAALKAGDRGGAQLWGREMAKYGKIVDQSRRCYLQAFEARLKAVGGRLGLGAAITVRYLPGWNAENALDAVLRDDLQRDLRHGCTHSGPHRGDFCVLVDGHGVRHRFSRGQMKLLVHALVVTQGQLLDRPAILLIDDLASELDLENQALLRELLVQTKEQIFITATQPETLAGFGSQRHRMFHVEQGRVVPV